MRTRILNSILLLIGILLPLAAHDSPKEDDKKPEPKIDKLDEQVLHRAKLSTDGDELLAFLKKRILPEGDRPQVEKFVRALGSSNYRIREKATLDLVALGPPSIDVLRSVPRTSVDRETLLRIEQLVKKIQEKDVSPEVRVAAIRVAALQHPKALVETLLGYAPFADNDGEVDEIRLALKQHAAKADALLAAALADRSAKRRAMAGEVLARTAYSAHKDALRKLLTDADANVRYRVARSLALAKERDAIPVLIDTLPDLPLNTAWQAEDFLLKLATPSDAPAAMGADKDTRDKCKAGWHEWWKKHGARADLAKLEDYPRMLGRTLIILLDSNRVVELGPDNLPRLDIKGINFPLDAQLLDDDRVLVAEYQANRVSERNAMGEVVWQKVLPGNINNGPQAAQRLPNGNTFIATSHHLYEYDKNDNVVVDISLAENGVQKIMKSMRLPSGEIVCMLAEGRIARFSPAGKELASFPISISSRLFGGRLHVLPSGRVLVPHNGEGKVVEYDARGKIIWEVPFDQPIAATRLPNGNTLITSMSAAVGAVEVDRAGAVVWSYRDAGNSRVTRAIRR